MSERESQEGGFTLRDAASRLGVSVKTVRRYPDRLGLPKSHAPAGASRWAKLVVMPETLDIIAGALGVQGDTRGDFAGTSADIQRDTALDKLGG